MSAVDECYRQALDWLVDYKKQTEPRETVNVLIQGHHYCDGERFQIECEMPLSEMEAICTAMELNDMEEASRLLSDFLDETVSLSELEVF